MMARVRSLDSLTKGGPYVGPKGGLYADPEHTTSWDPKQHGPVTPANCPRCRGLAHVVSRQTAIGGPDKVSAAPCRTCNPKGAVAFDPKKAKGLGLPALTPEPARRPEAASAQPKRQLGLDFRRPEQLRLDKAFKLAGETEFQGLDIAIEQRAGQKRRWRDAEGNTGHTVMVYPYGYIRGVEGADGDELDVYVGPKRESAVVFVVNQRSIKDARKFDEHKVMLGFETLEDAREGYLKHWQPRELGERMIGSIRTWTMERFKAWLRRRGAKKAPLRKAGARLVVPR